jgi:hypothetical protein
MDTAIRPLAELVGELPFEAQQEVRDFVEFLLAKHGRELGEPGNRLRQDWAGALRDYRQEYTSTELQHNRALVR